MVDRRRDEFRGQAASIHPAATPRLVDRPVPGPRPAEWVLLQFPNIRLADPDFVPTYYGMRGEIAPNLIPLLID